MAMKLLNIGKLSLLLDFMVRLLYQNSMNWIACSRWSTHLSIWRFLQNRRILLVM